MSKGFVRALLQWECVFGVPKDIRTNGGSQFTNLLTSNLCSLQGYDHLVVVAYHPQANRCDDIWRGFLVSIIM